MRVAILGDIHAGTRYLDWALEHAVNAGAEMMIQVGDFGFDFKDGFLSALADITDKHQIPLLAIRGNHDDPFWFRQHQTIGNVHLIPDGYAMTIGKKRVAFLGGAVSIDRNLREPHTSWWPDERVNPHIVNSWLYDDVKADVLISHDSPLLPDKLPGIILPADIRKDCEEDRNYVRMAAEILEPDVIVHGHYHVRHTKTLFMGGNKKALIEGLSCDGNPIKDTMLIQDW